MRVRAAAAIALLAVTVFVTSCSGSSGVNTEELTSSAGFTTTSATPTSSTISASPSTAPPSSSAVSTVGPSSATGADGLSPQESADRAAIEAQWNKMWQVYAALPHTPESERQALAAQVAVDPALSNLLTDANTLNSKGWDTYGQFTSRISWPQPVDGKATAVIADCQDASQAGSLETSSGKDAR